MIRALVKYYLPLCILLIGGYNQASAYANLSAFADKVESVSGVEYNSLENAEQFPHAFIINNSPAGSEKTLIIEDNDVEEEEDERIDVKKHLESFYASAAAYYSALQSEYFFHIVKNHLACYKHFTYFISSHRWYIIILQVFRI
ncbi:MAG: hypothetical protein CMO01_31090 [Thalassobius sp.]|nr:hypothetical protein [Thalassovita sp.]